MKVPLIIADEQEVHYNGLVQYTWASSPDTLKPIITTPGEFDVTEYRYDNPTHAADIFYSINPLYEVIGVEKALFIRRGAMMQGYKLLPSFGLWYAIKYWWLNIDKVNIPQELNRFLNRTDPVCISFQGREVIYQGPGRERELYRFLL